MGNDDKNALSILTARLARPVQIGTSHVGNPVGHIPTSPTSSGTDPRKNFRWLLQCMLSSDHVIKTRVYLNFNKLHTLSVVKS